MGRKKKMDTKKSDITSSEQIKERRQDKKKLRREREKKEKRTGEHPKKEKECKRQQHGQRKTELERKRCVKCKKKEYTNSDMDEFQHKHCV